MFKRKKKGQPKEIPVIRLSGIELKPAVTIGETTFFQLPLDKWMQTARFMGAVPYLKCRELFNLTPEQYEVYDSKLDELIEDMVDKVNHIAQERSQKLLAKRMQGLQASISRINIHRSNLKFAMTLLDVPELYYRIGVHALFLPGDNPAEMLNFEEQDRRIEILKKKEWLLIASLPIIRASLELPNSYFQPSSDAFRLKTETDRLIRESLGILTNSKGKAP